MSLRSGVALAVICALGSACANVDTVEPTYTVTELGAGVVARVGDEGITEHEIRAILRARDATARDAMELSIRDALLANLARERVQGALLNEIERRTLARALVEALWREATATAPTPPEVASWTERKWTVVDRPPSAQTLHAVARVKKPEQDALAFDVATRVAAVVQGAESPEQFSRLAKSIPHPGIELRVERLDAVTADGRLVTPQWPPKTLVTEYAEAANSLSAVGDISPVVKTAFGYHVILLIERVPEVRMSYDQRVKELGADIYQERAALLLAGLLEKQRKSIATERTRSAEELMKQVRVD